MPSTYSERLRLDLQANGENAGVWGEITNRNLGTLLESAIAGQRSIALTDANYTLTTANGLDDDARYAALLFTGTLTAQRDITVPLVSKFYRVTNSTNFPLVIKGSSGTTRTVGVGRTAFLFVNASGVTEAISDFNAIHIATLLSEVLNTATSSFQIPQGNVAQRPTGADGKIRYNAELVTYEGYSNGSWGQLGGGATGGGADKVFVLNDQVVTANYTIPTGKNASSAGPITINDGVEVTVSDGSTWTIV